MQQLFRMQSSAAVSSVTKKRRKKEPLPRHHLVERMSTSGLSDGGQAAMSLTLDVINVILQLALHLLLLTILQLCHLSLPLSPPVSSSSCLFPPCQPFCPSCYTVLLYFSRYCKIMSLLFFKMYYLCGKYYRPIEYSFPGSPGGATGKELICQCKKHRFSPWSGKWQPTPVFLPGNFHEQRGWWATVHGTAEGRT